MFWQALKALFTPSHSLPPRRTFSNVRTLTENEDRFLGSVYTETRIAKMHAFSNELVRTEHSVREGKLVFAQFF